MINNFDITKDAKFEELCEMLSLDEGLFDGAKSFLGGSAGNLSKGSFKFDASTDIDASETPEIDSELRKIQEAFNASENGAVRIKFLQWLVKSPEVRDNIKQLMNSPQ